jgi:glycosyltransferase involved in cell wall biosynthesis
LELIELLKKPLIESGLPVAAVRVGRVALITERSGPRTGIGRYVQMLYSGLEAAGVDVVQAMPRLPQLPNVSYRIFGLLGRDLQAFLTNYPMWSAYPEADVYHLATQTLASLLLFRRPKGRVVVTVHDIFPYMLRKDSQLRSPYGTDHFYHRLAMAGLRRADHLIAVSHYTKRCLVEILGLPPERITVVYHGIEHERFRPLPVSEAIRERYGLPAGRPYLIYVGSEDPRKNLKTLVSALARVRRELPGVELIKVGRSHFEWERQRLMELATELGVRAALRMLEDVPEDDLPLLYNLADLYVTPSLYEGFGFPVLEAMACGTPAVCVKAGSVPEIVGSAGVQVVPFDVETLASTVVALLRDSERRSQLRLRGQRNAAGFTWSATVEKTTAVYEAERGRQTIVS